MVNSKLDITETRAALAAEIRKGEMLSFCNKHKAWPLDALEEWSVPVDAKAFEWPYLEDFLHCCLQFGKAIVFPCVGESLSRVPMARNKDSPLGP